METKSFTVSRRNFLKSSGSLVIGFPLLASCWTSTEGATKAMADVLRDIDPSRVNAWLEVLKDGSIRVFTGKMELGQGIRIAVAQVAAEELNADISKVDVTLAETDVTPDEGYTVGSNSIESTAKTIRYAAATAREKLLELASKKLNVNKSDLELNDGAVKSKAGTTVSFAELLEGRQLTDKVSAEVQLRPKSQHRYIGKAIARKDIEKMVRGEQVYVQDLRFDGMVHARIIRPPAYKATLTKLDEAAIKKELPGIDKIVVNGSFIGIISTDEYDVVRGQEIVRKYSAWSSPQALPADIDLKEYIKSLEPDVQTVVNKGSVSLASSNTIKAEYFKPYIMHGSNGPSCAVAIFDNNTLTIWSHSQGVYPLRGAIRDMVGLPIEQIHIKGVPGAGCYGHNGADDVAADAALLAMAYPGKHIRLQWSRGDEHGWEPYGSAMLLSLQAKLDDKGKITDWGAEVWSDTHVARPRNDAGGLLGARYLEKPFSPRPAGFLGGTYRNAEPYYDIPNVKIDVRPFSGPLRTSALRGLGAYGNLFAVESFMDELAERAKKDPVDFRILHSTDERSVAVLKKIREMTSSEKLKKGEGIGFGFNRYDNGASYCAVATKLSVDQEGEVKILKMWGVIDSGEVINLDGLKNQTEGGMIQSASWTLMEEVKFDKNHVTSLHWESYPILRFSDVPEVYVEVIDRPDQPPMGAGEAAQGPTSAAIVNAIYKATGKRIRELPVRKSNLKG